MTIFDLGIAWNWEHDTDFVTLLEAACRSSGLSLLQITPGNLPEISHLLESKQLAFNAFFERVAESDRNFMPIIDWAGQNADLYINPYDKAYLTWDKTWLHTALTQTGLNTPATIVLPPFEDQPVIPTIDLEAFGGWFTIKPAHGGGGEGVVRAASSHDQVLQTRQEHPKERYLVQSHIYPLQLGMRSAWFRVIYCAGRVYPCWWEVDTHLYTPVTEIEERRYKLDPLREITATIASICGLDLFSSEMALAPDGRFVIVDYVNDLPDLRLKSKTIDGVPDGCVYGIIQQFIELVLGAKKNHDP